MQKSTSAGCIRISSGLLVPICSRLDFMSLDLFCAQLHNLPICLLAPGQFGASQIFSFPNQQAEKKQFPLFHFFAEVYQYIDCIVNLFSGKDFPSDCITDRAGNQAEEARIRTSNLFVFVFAIRQKKQGLGFLNFWFYLQSGRVSPDTNF